MRESPISAFVGGQRRDVPVYDPVTVDYPAYRYALPNGDIVAPALTSPSDITNRALRIPTPNGIAAIALDAPMIEDFEGFATATWPANKWFGYTEQYAIASGTAALDGGYSLRGESTTGATPAAVFKNDAATERNNRYSAIVQFGAVGDVTASLHVNGPTNDATTFYRNSYHAAINAETDTFELVRGDGGGAFTRESVTVPLSVGTPYQVAVDMHEGNTAAVLTNPINRQELARATMVGETSKASGYMGLSTTGGSTAPAFFDNIRPEGGPAVGSLGGTVGVIDQFNHASFTNYESDDFAAFAFDNTIVREGTHSLRLNAGEPGDDYLWSMPGGGLNHYPEVGDTFQVKYRTEATDANTAARFAFAKQTAGTSLNPSYLIAHHVDGNFYIGEITGTGEYRRARVSVGYPTATWLRAEVTWDSATSVTASVYNDETGALLGGPITGTMSGGMTSGGIEWWAQYNRNGPIHFDDIVLI